MEIKKTHMVSDDGDHLYAVQRSWAGNTKKLCVIGLHPSTADPDEDTDLIRRAINFAKSYGFSGVVIVNLFAYRTNDFGTIETMEALAKAVGPKNLKTIKGAASKCDGVFAMWGEGGNHADRARMTSRMLINELGYVVMHNSGQATPEYPLILAKRSGLSTGIRKVANGSRGMAQRIRNALNNHVKRVRS